MLGAYREAARPNQPPPSPLQRQVQRPRRRRRLRYRRSIVAIVVRAAAVLLLPTAVGIFGYYYFVAKPRRALPPRMESLASHDGRLLTSASSPRRKTAVNEIGTVTECNTTIHREWLRSPYVGPLSSQIWSTVRYDIGLGDGDEDGEENAYPFVLTNALAITRLSDRCAQDLRHARNSASGRHGFPDVPVRAAMCGEFCIRSDAARLSVMTASGCSCRELSSPPDGLGGEDWCRSAAGRILCTVAPELCPIGAARPCDPDDFGCPGRNYARKAATKEETANVCAGAWRGGVGVMASAVFCAITISLLLS